MHEVSFYDILGWQAADAVTTLASGFDNSVLRIGTTYNALGDAYQVTTYNAVTGGNIVNQVENLYHGLGQLAQQYQSHSGMWSRARRRACNTPTPRCPAGKTTAGSPA